MRYVPNYNIRDRQYTSLHTSGELPSLPSLLPTSKSAHDKQYIDKAKQKKNGTKVHKHTTHTDRDRDWCAQTQARGVATPNSAKRRNRSTAVRI